MCYLDDGTLGGDAEAVYSTFERIMEASSTLGLRVNS